MVSTLDSVKAAYKYLYGDVLTDEQAMFLIRRESIIKDL